MILYDPTIPAGLLEFGILIPIRDSRATKTFEALCSDSHLGSRQDLWHRHRISETLTKEDLLRVHSADYVARLYSDRLVDEIISTFELIDSDGRYYRYAPEQASRPLEELFGRIRIKVAGSIQCARLAKTHGFCFYFSGGMHHAYYDHGSGFCLINDIVIATRKLQAENVVRKVWIIDVDAHKGDGTAALTADDASITTLSVHMAHGWPLDGLPVLPDGRANPCFIPSDIDIPIASGEEPHYLERLEKGLGQMKRLGEPDLAIVVSGADPYEKDELPSTSGLKLTLDQMAARDRMIYQFLRELRIPAAYLMAGGYGDQVWEVYAQFLSWALKK
ncbi:MAG: histone deacetylase [Desulfobacterales bacterium]|jgi:acetoin utilization deacetylase AcuC-like enzyme